MTISDIATKTKDLHAKISKMRTDYRAEVQKIFTEVTAEFFVNTPEVKSIHWTQYSPYFNDGEDCVFGVGEVYYNLDRNFGLSESEDEDDEDYEDEGDAFSNQTIAELEKRLEIYKNITSGDIPENELAELAKTYPYYYVFDNVYGNYNRPANPTFNFTKLSAQINSIHSSIAAIEKEKIQYPNRDTVIENFNAISEMISNIDSDMMEDMFGNHVKVIITKNGTSVDDYDHD